MQPAVTTHIEVARFGGRSRCDLRAGHLSPRRLPSAPGLTRVALVATGALLLVDDHVHIDVVVGAGAVLELTEVAGTVAYDMRGGQATWCVRATVGAGGALIWPGQPLVVCDGADVFRSSRFTLHETALLVTRETYVFGRTGEQGGDLRTATYATLGGCPALVEDLQLSRGSRSELGVLAGARCLDTVTVLGKRLRLPPAGALQLELPGTIERRALDALHRSDLGTRLAAATADIPGSASRPQPPRSWS